jgi:hypothetical protein
MMYFLDVKQYDPRIVKIYPNEIKAKSKVHGSKKETDKGTKQHLIIKYYLQNCYGLQLTRKSQIWSGELAKSKGL